MGSRWREPSEAPRIGPLSAQEHHQNQSHTYRKDRRQRKTKQHGEDHVIGPQPGRCANVILDARDRGEDTLPSTAGMRLTGTSMSV